MTSLEATEAILEAGVRDGIYEISSVGPNGEKRYRMTEKGKREAEVMLRAHGIDPDDKEAVRVFLGLPERN